MIERRRQVNNDRRLLVPRREDAGVLADADVLCEVPDDFAGGFVDEDEGVAEVWVGRGACIGEGDIVGSCISFFC